MSAPWRKLTLWEKAHQLVLEVYQSTGAFPSHERYALVSQIRRAAYSIPCNIVEGQSRNTTKDYLGFLHIARGSLEELRYLMLLSRDLGYVAKTAQKKLEDRCEEVSRMLNGLIQSLKTRLDS